MIHFTEAVAITIQFVLNNGSYKDLTLVLKIVNDCDCFMLFAKLFQSRIFLEKKRFRKRFPMYSWYEDGVISSEQIIVCIMRC